MSHIQRAEFQLDDALREVIGAGVRYAAGSLNELVGQPVSLRVPEAGVLPLREAELRVAAFGWTRAAAVQLSFSGPLKGSAVLAFPCESAVKLITQLTGDRGCHPDLDAIRAATLEEAGNIILNGVIGALSNGLAGRLAYSIPCYSEQAGLPARIAGREASSGVQVVIAGAQFVLADHVFEGAIFLFLEPRVLEKLRDALEDRTDS